MFGNLYRLTKSQTGERTSGEFHRAVSNHAGFMISKSFCSPLVAGFDFGDPASSTEQTGCLLPVEILNTFG